MWVPEEELLTRSFGESEPGVELRRELKSKAWTPPREISVGHLSRHKQAVRRGSDQ